MLVTYWNFDVVTESGLLSNSFSLSVSIGLSVLGHSTVGLISLRIGDYNQLDKHLRNSSYSCGKNYDLFDSLRCLLILHVGHTKAICKKMGDMPHKNESICSRSDFMYRRCLAHNCINSDSQWSCAEVCYRTILPQPVAFISPSSVNNAKPFYKTALYIIPRWRRSNYSSASL
jgi:hypothetical protein